VREKQRLIRLVRLTDGRLFADSTGCAAGRGAYLCPTPACLEAVLKRGTLARILRGPVLVGDDTLAFLRTQICGATG
jgi:predicted RNA-binding protein YlxR (DUF448 family)